MNKLLKDPKKIFLALLLMLVTGYILLAYKAPYSTRTLVPNAEPFPDTLYYGNPAWNAAQGNGFVMKALDYESKIITPPLYSIYLIPFFAVFDDVRSFYFANILLGVGSLVLFTLTIRKLFNDGFGLLVTAFLGLLYITNFYIYYIPSLLMAENITIFVSMIAVFLLVDDVNKKNTILAGITGTALSLIKLSNLPLSAAFYFLYFLKLMHSKVSTKFKKTYIIVAGITAIFFMGYIFATGLLVGHKNLSSGAGFSTKYVITNFMKYTSFLFGAPSHFIWYEHRMVNSLLEIPIILGIFYGLYSKKWRAITLQFLIYGLSVILFMSAFYFVDSRYILMLYPLLLVFAGIMFYAVKERMNTKISILLLILSGIGYLVLSQSGQIQGERPAITFKKQLGLNFKHAEVPWNYIAVTEFNNYFDKPNNKIYLGSFLPPYFVDFYANDNYNYLPISMGQEFYYDRINASNEYVTHLPDYYKKLLEKGNDIYISRYYQNNQSEGWKKDFDTLTKDFTLTKVHEGCLGGCDIYRITFPANKE